MYYIKNGLTSKFIVFTSLLQQDSRTGIGNGVQALASQELIINWLSTFSIGIVIAILVALGFLVELNPLETSIEVSTCNVSYSFLVACDDGNCIDTLTDRNPAFTTTVATGGFGGATVWMALRYGVARGVFQMKQDSVVLR